MILGILYRQLPLPLMVSGQTVDQVTSFKLLGVTVMDSLKWGHHIDAVTAKAAKHLWFLKNQSKQAYPSLILSTITKRLSDMS